MRSGAIFARGSCRALKWMALFSVVFALGAGSAAAQIKVSEVKTVAEGGRLTFTVTPEIRVPAGGAADTLTVTATAAVAVDDGSANDVVDATKLQTVAETPQDFSTTPVAATWNVLVNNDNADPSDRTLDPETITLQIGTDLDAEDERITVTFAISSGGTTTYTNKGGTDTLDFADDATPQHITIDDADDQEFVWEVTTAKPKEGAPIAVTLTADPTPFQLSYETVLRVDTTGYSLTPSSFEFDVTEDTAGEDGPIATLAITPPTSDENRDMDTIMVEATVAGTASSRVPALPIEVADIHALPMADKISAKAYMDDGEGKASKPS